MHPQAVGQSLFTFRSLHRRAAVHVCRCTSFSMTLNLTAPVRLASDQAQHYDYPPCMSFEGDESGVGKLTNFSLALYLRHVSAALSWAMCQDLGNLIPTIGTAWANAAPLISLFPSSCFISNVCMTRPGPVAMQHGPTLRLEAES